MKLPSKNSAFIQQILAGQGLGSKNWGQSSDQARHWSYILVDAVAVQQDHQARNYSPLDDERLQGEKYGRER